VTEGKLNDLETVCRVEADKDGTVRLRAGDILELVNELRERRKHAADLSEHQSAIANLNRILASLVAYGVSEPEDDSNTTGRIAIQDPGR
jgi:hypothetical protein